MTDRPLKTNNYFTKIADQISDDLRVGFLTFEEYGLLIYMLQQADKKTGTLITNSRLLAIELNVDRAWVHNRLTSLKKKSRIQSLTRGRTDLNQSRGNTQPYAIRLSDHISYDSKTRDKPEANQKLTREKPPELTRGQNTKPAEPAETLEKTENGTFLAKKDSDLEKEKEKKRSPNNVNILSKEKAEDLGMYLLKFYQGCCNPNIEAHMEMLQQIGGYGTEKVVELVKQAKEEHVKYWEVMQWVTDRIQKQI